MHAIAQRLAGKDVEDDLESVDHSEREGKASGSTPEDSLSTDHEHSRTSSGFTGKEEVSESEKLQLAKKETLAVFRLRLLVFLVLLLAAAAGKPTLFRSSFLILISCSFQRLLNSI